MNRERFAQLDIDLRSVLHNYKFFRSRLKKSTKLLILVKANSYGHGAVEFANILQDAGVDYFGVAYPIEGIELRAAGITTPIIVLSCGTDHYKEVIENSLEPAIPNLYSLKKFCRQAIKMGVKEYPVHINTDSGMHRLGFVEKELPALLNFLRKSRQVRVKSIYSHLAASDEKKWDKFTLEQIHKFNKMADEIDGVLGYRPMHHILNSAGIERFPQHQMDMVRLGLGIYGISPSGGKGLKPVASLKCKILQIKELVPEDGTVGYGRHGKIVRPSKIATIPLGYADGIDRRLGRGAAGFCVKGKLAPTVGNICMDMCMIDVTAIKDVKVGDTVTIFGDKPTAEDLAKILKTIPYEILTSVDRRVDRVIKG